MKKTKVISIIIFILYLFSLSAGAIEKIDIQAKSVILADPVSGQILYTKNELQKAYPASITKLMTALLVVEHADQLGEVITISPSALQNLSDAGSTVNLKAGEKITVDYLLICLMVASANEAANILAEHVSGSVEKFVEQMNQRAAELGCKNTHFVNPHGLHNDEHYTCAYDVYLIAREAQKHKRLTEIYSMPKATIPQTNLSPERVFFSTNSMLSPFKERNYLYQYTTGIKTGHTSQAGLCLAASATRDETSLLSVVLGAPRGANGEKNHFVETTRLFKWGFDNFKTATILTPTNPVAEAKVKLAWDRDYVIAVPKTSFERLVPSDYDAKKLQMEPILPDNISAPIEKGAKLGTVKLMYDGMEYGTVDLVAADSIKRSELLYLWDLVMRFFQSKITKIVLFSIAVLLVLYVIFMISSNRKRRYRKQRSYRGKRR